MFTPSPHPVPGADGGQVVEGQVAGLGPDEGVDGVDAAGGGHDDGVAQTVARSSGKAEGELADVGGHAVDLDAVAAFGADLGPVGGGVTTDPVDVVDDDPLL